MTRSTLSDLKSRRAKFIGLQRSDWGGSVGGFEIRAQLLGAGWEHIGFEISKPEIQRIATQRRGRATRI
jgi:hypothetical protein